MGKHGFLFLACDAAPGLGFVFRPEVRRNNRNGNPAQMQREIMQPFQKVGDGNLVFLEHGKEIVGGGFQQFLVTKSIEGFRLEHAGVTLAAALLAA